jgi:hypothetical protein
LQAPVTKSKKVKEKICLLLFTYNSNNLTSKNWEGKEEKVKDKISPLFL